VKKSSRATKQAPLIDQSQAKTGADTMNLHRVPLLAARRHDAATVKRVGSSARREVRGLGDDTSHGLSPRKARAI